MLFADFILSKEGQQLLKEHNRVPSSNAVDSPLNKFPYQMIDPGITLDEAEKWETMWANLFHHGTAPKKAEE
jgi:iron(III) transport system substrate-binding protein